VLSVSCYHLSFLTLCSHRAFLLFVAIGPIALFQSWGVLRLDLYADSNNTIKQCMSIADWYRPVARGFEGFDQTF